MQFAVMKWVGITAKSGTIFAVLDKNNPAQLPMLTPEGHWEDFRVIDEARFKFTEEAKKAIADSGYFLIGANVTVTETFGQPPTSWGM